MAGQYEQLQGKRHTLAHLLAAAVRELFPGAQNAIGPAIEDGFYQDFELLQPIADKDLKQIEKKMRELLKTWHSSERREVSMEEAKKEFAWNKYKLELAEEVNTAGTPLTFYTIGGFVDLCKGGHADDAQAIAPDSFRLDRIAGAYWRGNENNTMLTRIYGLAFNTKQELADYLAMREEAKKRDHKKLGPQLDLFTFSDLVGAGLPLWTPKGTLVRDLLADYVQDLRKARGYENVEIPHITKKELYEISGHWDKFKDQLFRIRSREGHEFVMKPMNCPHHTQIYARKQHSYRDLPVRYANTTMCYRDEQSGEISGLSRVRAFTQDDAHVFARYGQLKEEFMKVWDIVETFYGSAGFKLTPKLSFSDPSQPENYLGTREVWETAEQALLEIAKERGVTAEVITGEAAFYGPKIDFMAKDSLGREWQVATIQLDMNMPERFDLTCVNEDGQPERIIMIHAAIMGSIERFLAVYLEHTAGNFPLWLSPVQLVIMPISEKQTAYAQALREKLQTALPELRLEIDSRDESIGKKIREATLAKVPYQIIIGEKEQSAETIAVRTREGQDLGSLSLKELEKLVLARLADKS